ncbi:MAG: hypothetical protein CBC83_02510 [Flavobacteriales bacterium TMED123]|nr:MAG: hypothetical protein CBC83_02510 [Flavobacteriales bacterium TMED123]
MILSDLEKENLAALAGTIYTFDPLIERGKTHNLYHGVNQCSTGYSKYNMCELSSIACEKYIVENKLLRREGDARTVETRFDFPDYYIIVNKQSYVYPNHHVGKTLLILPKSRYINGFTKYNVWETAINYYHKYINELFTNDNSYPLEVLKKKVFEFKNQKYYPTLVFNYNGTQYADHLYPLYYKVVINNVYKIDHIDFKNDIKNMVFKIGFELYINVNSIKVEVTYKMGKIIKVSCSNYLNVKSIHFNHYYYNGNDFSIGRYNFYSSIEFEREMLNQIYQYYTSKIDFDCGYILNKMRYRECHRDILKKILYMKPAVKLFIFATMIPRDELKYPLLNSLVVRKIVEEFY